MLRGFISKRGKLTLLYIDSGYKIDQHYYIKHVQQDHHLLQHAHTCTQEWFTENLSNFLTLLWLASSLDLNPWKYFGLEIDNTKSHNSRQD
jgi:hypothetical protein